MLQQTLQKNKPNVYACLFQVFFTCRFLRWLKIYLIFYVVFAFNFKNNFPVNCPNEREKFITSKSFTCCFALISHWKDKTRRVCVNVTFVKFCSSFEYILL